MSYYFSKFVDANFDEAIEKVTDELKKEGLGIITEIDVSATFKKKLDVDFPKYHILGACHPQYAHKAILAETHIGTMLPCNVVVREAEDHRVEVFAVDPIASMSAIQNKELGAVAQEIQAKMKKVIANL